MLATLGLHFKIPQEEMRLLHLHQPSLWDQVRGLGKTTDDCSELHRPHLERSRVDLEYVFKQDRIQIIFIINFAISNYAN